MKKTVFSLNNVIISRFQMNCYKICIRKIYGIVTRLYHRWSKFLAYTVGVFLLIYCILPILFQFSSSVRGLFLFSHYFKVPMYVDYSHPEKFGLPCSKNFYIPSADILLGTWHIFPKEKNCETLLSDAKAVIIYLHGNSGSRASEHRLHLYKLLVRLGYHVITFDYRGYGDSTSRPPDEDGLVQDAISVYQFVKSSAGLSPVFIWGHSLGTGVGCKMMAQLCQKQENMLSLPRGLILEAPFNNIADEVRNHPLSIFYRWLPFFDWLFVEPLHSSGLMFLNDVHLPKVTIPIIMLHAEDDEIIPLFLAQKVLRLPSMGTITLRTFPKYLGYGHKNISTDPEFPKIIK